MFKIYNKQALTRQQRFSNACVVGVGASILCVVLFMALLLFLKIYSPLLLLPMGFLIGYVIQRFGKGVQIQFSLLALGLTLAVIFACDMLAYGSVQLLLSDLLEFGQYSILQLIYRAGACYLAYSNARVV